MTATGTIEPITKVDVGTQVSGTISHIYVDYNSVVTKGQLLAELDRETTRSRVEIGNGKSRNQAKVNSSTKIKISSACTSYTKKNLISETEYEEALYQYEKAQQALRESTSHDGKGSIKPRLRNDSPSPIDGVVLSREVEEGQTVAASFETPTMFTIANDLRKMQVIADVDEADIGQVLEGQRVTFTVDAFRMTHVRGRRVNPTTESKFVTKTRQQNPTWSNLRMKKIP